MYSLLGQRSLFAFVREVPSNGVDREPASVLISAAMRSVGLDFGTTNSAIGVVDGDGDDVTLASFEHAGGLTRTFRSILYFHPELRDARGRLAPVAGPRAIDRYLEADGTGRLVQSLKSYLADRGFQATSIFQKTHTVVELLTMILVDLRARAEEKLGPLGTRIVVGRPVRFAHADAPEDEQLAVERLTAALAGAGFSEAVFEYEPVAAAYYYESRLDRDERVLVADFGGGTSDFSIVEVGPSRRTTARKILANDGVGLAGDALDAKILHHVVAPILGMGTSYKAMFGRELPVPVWIYGRLRRWHHLSFLKTQKNMALLEEIADQAVEPVRIRALLHILENDLGYHLYRAVEQVKVALSQSDSTSFTFRDEPLEIEAEVTRADFESWISEETTAMADSVDRVLVTAGLGAKDIDRVFLTGGTSFVPAVRKLFDDRFGAEKISAGGEMISVATGLALRARDA
jgi:hypothetical chaperone protein